MAVRITTFILLAVIAVVCGRKLARKDDDYYDYLTEEPDYDYSTKESGCNPSVCSPPNCFCFGQQPKIPVARRPQFVMLTFDDAITVANIETYREIVYNRKNKGNREPIKLTFFVCHEYNNYEFANELYSEGHEIAVHSISHESNTDLWRRGNATKWKKEMVGMKTILSTFGFIPKNEIRGHRAPFLQTAGKTTFEMLEAEGFLYDSSMPTRTFRDPPIWPYTLDFGYLQDCQIEPCPDGLYPGVWEVPMIQFDLPSNEGIFYCSMADACTPVPQTAVETKEYLLHNFNRHYKSNKAPVPVFLHQAWLQDESRLQGYLDFVDDILTHDDVFVVTVNDVIEYMKNPVQYTQYRSYKQEKAKSCDYAHTCRYDEPLRNMQSCATCPKYYPWVGTPLGGRKPDL